MGESKFTGGAGGYIGRSLLMFPMLILGVVTFGIMLAWYSCYWKRWLIGNTYCDGYRLKFDGTTMSLWANWIKWMLLSIITIGIYSLWIPVKALDWTARNTHFAG